MAKPKTICFDKYYVNFFMVFLVIFVIIIGLFMYSFYERQKVNERYQSPSIQDSEQSQDVEQRQESEQNQYVEQVKRPVQQNVIVSMPFPVRGENKVINSLDRIYNPIKYPYKSDNYYEQTWYPDLELPFQVIGGGYRNIPTLGGTQVPIYNPPLPINISNANIAPVNISTRGPLGMPQQIGTLYKIYGNNNEYLPLYGRRRYPNDSKYDYYTISGRQNVKIPVVIKNKNDEIGTNDVVFLKGSSDPYRVTVYESDFAEYIPYI